MALVVPDSCAIDCDQFKLQHAYVRLGCLCIPHPRNLNSILYSQFRDLRGRGILDSQGACQAGAELKTFERVRLLHRSTIHPVRSGNNLPIVGSCFTLRVSVYLAYVKTQLTGVGYDFLVFNPFFGTFPNDSSAGGEITSKNALIPRSMPSFVLT